MPSKFKYFSSLCEPCYNRISNYWAKLASTSSDCSSNIVSSGINFVSFDKSILKDLLKYPYNDAFSVYLIELQKNTCTFDGFSNF